MVSVVHSVAAQSDDQRFLQTLSAGLSAEEVKRLESALSFAREVYGDSALLESGEEMFSHTSGNALIIAGLKLDIDTRLAALLFAVPQCRKTGLAEIERRFGNDVAQLVDGVSKLSRLHPLAQGFAANGGSGNHRSQDARAQVEVLRKMFLAMAKDIRVVLLRLASHMQTLRHCAAHPDEARRQEVARETMALYSPLANRLGVWELKWELEDLSFRSLHPETYRKIAQMLDEKRSERELFIAEAIRRLQKELQAQGIEASINGRPKHIYSIWNKMSKKGVAFSELYDIRALRVIVNEIKDCYTVLGIVHNFWTPIPKEFDDYISKPKGNHYRSLHTAVRCQDGRSLEVQIRTWEMHRHAEMGVAAHWRYKEDEKRGGQSGYDEKIAWLRNLLTWKEDVTGTSDWLRHYRQAALDETIYVLTPQGRVVDLQQGATPVDFAYRIHTDLGHRCRGAKVDGVLAPLNTRLKTGQKVEVIAVRQGGPSRDWLNAAQGYLNTKSAREKARQWFSNQALEASLSEGKGIIAKEMQRLGQSGANLDEVARRMNFARADDLYIAAARNELPLRQFQAVVRGDAAELPEEPSPLSALLRPFAEKHPKGILVVGVDKLMTQLARCCKPAPLDAIEGFVTRGNGVSIHRADCSNFQNLKLRHPERVVEADWGVTESEETFATDIIVDAQDRQGLLRDISEVFARERINVAGVNTRSRQSRARMEFTVEVRNLQQLRRTLELVQGIAGVETARRG